MMVNHEDHLCFYIHLSEFSSDRWMLDVEDVGDCIYQVIWEFK